MNTSFTFILERKPWRHIKLIRACLLAVLSSQRLVLNNLISLSNYHVILVLIGKSNSLPITSQCILSGSIVIRPSEWWNFRIRFMRVILQGLSSRLWWWLYRWNTGDILRNFWVSVPSVFWSSFWYSFRRVVSILRAHIFLIRLIRRHTVERHRWNTWPY